MQSDSFAVLFHPCLHLLAAVNPEVVEHNVQRRRVGIDLEQTLQRQEEQQAVLPYARRIVNASRFGVQGSAYIPLDVLPRRHHFLLFAAIHPIRADLGVQMNVDLVKIESHFPGLHPMHCPANHPQTPVFCGL